MVENVHGLIRVELAGTIDRTEFDVDGKRIVCGRDGPLNGREFWRWGDAWVENPPDGQETGVIIYDDHSVRLPDGTVMDEMAFFAYEQSWGKS
jgi:hypothetical protein